MRYCGSAGAGSPDGRADDACPDDDHDHHRLDPHGAGTARPDRRRDRRQRRNRARDRSPGPMPRAREVVLTGRNPSGSRRPRSTSARDSTAALRRHRSHGIAAILRRSAGADRPRDGHRPAAPTTGRCSSMDCRGRAHDAQRSHRRCRSRSPATPSPGCGPAARCCFMGGTGGRRISRELGIVVGCHGGAAAVHRRPSRWSSRRFASTSSLPASSTPRCLRRTSRRRRSTARRDELRATLPIGRVVGPADVAALAVHIMTNTALTGATYDIDGGQQFVS